MPSSPLRVSNDVAILMLRITCCALAASYGVVRGGLPSDGSYGLSERLTLVAGDEPK